MMDHIAVKGQSGTFAAYIARPKTSPVPAVERSDGVHLSYDKMASFLAPYGNREALQVAEDLDHKVETLLREAAALMSV